MTQWKVFLCGWFHHCLVQEFDVEKWMLIFELLAIFFIWISYGKKKLQDDFGLHSIYNVKYCCKFYERLVQEFNVEKWMFEPLAIFFYLPIL